MPASEPVLPLAKRRIRVLVVDDEPPARAKLKRWVSEQPDFDLVGEAGDGLLATQLIGSLRPDLVFLDIQMPDMNGLEVAAHLQRGSGPLLVFVTAHDDHAVEAFDLNAIDYLLKPYDHDRFLRALGRIRERLAAPAGQDARPGRDAAVGVARSALGPGKRLPVPDGERLRLIECSAIHWLQADDNYVHVHVGAREFLLRRTLQDLLAQLGEERFARIHKSAAVNVAEIETLERMPKGDYEVHLRSGARLRLSRRYAHTLLARTRS
jgi:two-component system LytT family response regulator